MPDPALSRRRALTAAASGLTLPLLTACGGGSSPGAGGGQSSAPSGNRSSSNPGKGPSSAPAPGLVASKDVPVGGGVILADQDVVVTQPTKGTFHGFSATCTHMGCILASVAAGTINCGCHGSQFSITDGANVAGPMGSPAGSVPALPRVAVTVKGGEVLKG